MLKDFTKLVLLSKAAVDILKEKLESKASEFIVQAKNFTDKSSKSPITDSKETCKLKEKAQEEITQILSEVSHRAQINELQVKGFIRDKLTELTNNALLDSTELNDIRAEIASLHAEIADLKDKVTVKNKNG